MIVVWYNDYWLNFNYKKRGTYIMTSTEILFSGFTIFGLLFSFAPIVFFIWFAITTVKQLKKQFEK